VRKLKETLVTVQQLDKNMSNLRTWLSRIETELSKPVVYRVCHSDEIQKKLCEQQLQDLQRDIEQHTESVASVLTLCDVLLHDVDACGADSENDSIQQTTRSLDRRWRNICAMSMERRMIEETWRLWCKFLDDYSRFEEWLKTAELTAASPESANVLYTNGKEELKKFEAFQRQVHERLTQLELVNKQYRRLARENRTDAACKLRVMVQDGNQRWDCLQKRVAAVLRRLKHFTSQREEFEGSREGILVWLTEMDLQLTNVEHFSKSDIEDKMRQLKGFQQEITLNTNKIDTLIVFGENLIQKSSPLDAVLIEDELEELHSYCQEVFGRVARFHQRLVNRRPVRREEEEDESPSMGRAMCHLLVPPREHSGRETPVSVDSIPLEWDHTVDVGGSSSHEDDEDATFFSALSVIERWELQQTQKLPGEKDALEQWQKLNCDLCDVTSWLGRVLPELERLQRIAEMQKNFNTYKCLMISVNLSAHHFLQSDSVELRELQEALSSANHSWTQACRVLESWERRLHSALLQCQEELRARRRQVSALQDISSQLLLENTGEESVEAKEKIHVIGNKLHLRPFLVRVLRAALPLHLLFFLLLVLICHLPLSDHYSCTLSNNFARSFYPMLRYTNGPPPT
uniref:Spectrin repeat containing, nuclear envelope 2b n=1 Tax=Kryptolebias marmoratus TaxID=37003 RepID=A0A3Q3BAP6_KRYMA